MGVFFLFGVALGGLFLGRSFVCVCVWAWCVSKEERREMSRKSKKSTETKKEKKGPEDQNNEETADNTQQEAKARH